MTFPASGVCFYCHNPVNFKGRYVFATIRHNYKNGQSRESDRHFHPVCFLKFKMQGGRPMNPKTVYEVIDCDERTGDDQ